MLRTLYIFAIAFCLALLACTRREKKTIVIDDVVQSKQQLERLDTSEIFSYTEWPPETAPLRYYKWNKTTLVVVKTKKVESKLQKQRHAILTQFLDSADKGADILIMEDGVEIPPSERKQLHILSPDQLSNVDTIERNAAKKLYGSLAKPITLIINTYTHELQPPSKSQLD